MATASHDALELLGRDRIQVETTSEVNHANPCAMNGAVLAAVAHRLSAAAPRRVCAEPRVPAL